MATQETVTARRAGDMTGLSERTIRRYISAGRLDATRLADGDYAIPVRALDGLRRQAKARATRRGDLAGELASLRAEVEALRSRVEALEARPTSSTSRASEIIARLSRQDDTETALPVVARTLSPAPPESHYNAIQGQGAYAGRTGRPRRRMPAAGDDFTTASEAIAWLIPSHCNAGEGTPKSWRGWQEVTLTKAGVLALAIGERDGNHRRPWRLHRCDDPDCVCHALLGV